MRRIIATFAFALVLTFTAAAAAFVSPANAEASCNGQCKRNYNACLNNADTISEASQCKKAYQGCISSCK